MAKIEFGVFSRVFGLIHFAAPVLLALFTGIFLIKAGTLMSAAVLRGVFLRIFALVYNERKQLVNAGVEMLKAPVHLAFKMLNFALEKMNFLFDFFSPLIDGVVDKLKRDFLNRGMDEVFHMVKVYRICAGPSNVFYFYFYLKRGRLDNFLIHSPTVQDQPCPPRRFAAKAAGRGV